MAEYEFNPAALHAARRLAGLSQAKLAKKAGLPRPSVTNYEAGKRVPTNKNIARLAQALEKSPICFFRRTDNDA